MYLNTFLLYFGFDPDNFVNELSDPIEADDGSIIYNLRQRIDKHICPHCGCIEATINDYFFVNVRVTSNSGLKTILHIKKVRFKCKACHKTYTSKINGIERYGKISNQTLKLLENDFKKQKAFSIIADDYQMSTARVMQFFDMTYPYISRNKLSQALCIDEISFKTEDGSYACILYDHRKRIVIDVLRNRQQAYLKDYFSHCSYKERNEVNVFVSDLYEGYSSIKEEFFPHAIHVADLFHVIRLLTHEISVLRVQTIKQYTQDGDLERYFMKTHWTLFESNLNSEKMKQPFYSKKEKATLTYWGVMKRCLQLNMDLWESFSCLQSFFEYWHFSSFENARKELQRIYTKLKNTGNEGLVRVASTYKKWEIEICNAFTLKDETGKRYSNGPAEGLNSLIKTLIKDANGYRNFERFRKRVLIVVNNRKDPS